MNHGHTLIVNGKVILVSEFARVNRMGRIYTSEGFRVLVKPASRADWSQYRRAIAR